MSIAIGVVIPTNISNDYNEITNIEGIVNDNLYYYQRTINNNESHCVEGYYVNGVWKDWSEVPFSNELENSFIRIGLVDTISDRLQMIFNDEDRIYSINDRINDELHSLIYQYRQSQLIVRTDDLISFDD